MQFNHQRVLLIGAATGIGFSVLEHLVKSGAQVVAADRQLELLLENSETLRQQFPQQMTCQYLDLAEHHTLISQVEGWIQQYGDFDHLVCCAGVLPVGSLHKMPLEQVKQAFDINTFGVLAAMQAVTSGMQQRRRGSMVVILSSSSSSSSFNVRLFLMLGLVARAWVAKQAQSTLYFIHYPQHLHSHHTYGQHAQ